MNTVYVLVPLLKIDSIDHIIPESLKLLQIDSLNPSSNLVLHQIGSNEYALRISSLDINFLSINRILQTSQQNEARLQILQNALREYQYNPIAEEQEKSESISQLQKKLKKYQSLKDQNKKLKRLLQVQLQNTQKVRQQTQKTMKVLRQQFDALVVEMGRKQRNSVDFAHGHDLSELQPNHGQQKGTFLPSNATKHTSIR